MTQPALSRFTPSLMPGDLLERLFVGRERLLATVMGRIEAATRSRERNHTLLVGPRGAGKTHVVALAHHRAATLRNDGARLQLAWLPEDPWTIVSYKYLLGAIAERLGLPVSGRPDEDLEETLTARAVEGGVIVVLVENLDQILAALGNAGQQRLRHFLQASGALLLVATSTQLDRTLSDQASPFYAFFTTTRLEPFDVDTASEMLRAIAAEHGQDDVADYMSTAEGRARLHTIAHLAGGQPRMWSALASSLSVQGLSELVDLLLTRFDDLTPYYQEQLGRLSGRQRLVVAELARLDRPINVKQLGDHLGLDQRSVGKTMTELVERRWAAPISSPLTQGLVDRRRTYYELAEPMARLAFQIKESRGEPLGLVVDFLKAWFDAAQLRSTEDGIVRMYLDAARKAEASDPAVALVRGLQLLPARPGTLGLCARLDDALLSLAQGRAEAFLALSTPVRATAEGLAQQSSLAHVRVRVHHVALRSARSRPDEAGSAATWVARAASLGSSLPQDSHSLVVRWLARAGRLEEALVGLDQSPSGSDDERMIGALFDVAQTLVSRERPEEAAPLLERVVSAYERMPYPGSLLATMSRTDLLRAYQQAGRSEDAATLCLTLVRDMARQAQEAHSEEVRSMCSQLLDNYTAELTALRGTTHPDSLEAAYLLAEASSRPVADAEGRAL